MDALKERYGVNNHWQRDFKTDDSVDEDWQLDIEMDASAEWEIFGFYQSAKSLAFDDSLGGLFVGDVKTFTPLSEIWKAEVQLAELIAKNDDIEEEIKAVEARVAKVEEEQKAIEKAAAELAADKDGARQFTAQATAVLVAVYALAF